VNLVLFGMWNTMVVISDIHWASLKRHIEGCDKCRGCDTCRTENCAGATLMIETMLTPGKANDPAR
jgi:hypothetical protein